MALPCEVEVLDICQISPPAGSVPTTTLSLSFLDLSYLALPPVQMLYYYELHLPKAYFMDTILPNIKHSFSITLQHYYPLAGQIIWPQKSAKPEIVYTDGDSVPVVVAESDQDFQHLSGSCVRNANQFYLLAPTYEHAVSDHKRVPLFAVQVTLFPNKGFCIGVVYNHAAIDGATFYLFMKFWATVCASQGNASALSNSLPSFDRTAVKDPNGIETINLNDLKLINITKETYTLLKVPIIPVDKVRCAFAMKHTEVMKLKQWVLDRIGKEKQAASPPNLSTFVLICSFVWVCLIRAKHATENMIGAEDQTEYFMFPVDCRARLDPPLPKTYFGNCIGGVVVQCGRNELISENGFAAAAKAIAKVVMNVNSEVLSSMKKGLAPFMALPLDRTVSVAGSPRFTAYENDFGWGKPKKEESGFLSRAIVLSDCPVEDGATEIKLVRNGLEMVAFNSLFEESLKSLS